MERVDQCGTLLGGDAYLSASTQEAGFWDSFGVPMETSPESGPFATVAGWKPLGVGRIDETFLGKAGCIEAACVVSNYHMLAPIKGK
ncbi:hypothetical protein [Ferrimonas gelatinilytica]|uniref:Uncharacterized protein n=1 Tax=Ferrimonas gelatinilytica TaxID=1255257 RepID=A0ABP9RXW0_9GAMM